MNQKEKTHYRKAFNSPYLSSADLVEPTTLTISHVTYSGDATKKTKDHFNTAHFVEKELRPGEPLKPMILNAGNSRTMKVLTGSAYIDDWNNVTVQIYVDGNVRFGRETVEGLRISPNKVNAKKPDLKPGGNDWARAVEAVARAGNTDVVREHRSLTAANERKLMEEAGVL